MDTSREIALEADQDLVGAIGTDVEDPPALGPTPEAHLVAAGETAEGAILLNVTAETTAIGTEIEETRAGLLRLARAGAALAATAAKGLAPHPDLSQSLVAADPSPQESLDLQRRRMGPPLRWLQATPN